MSQSPDILEKLRPAPLFREFTDRELEDLVSLLDIAEYKAGDCIVRQDEVGDCMYLLVEGEARVIHHRAGREIALADMQPGDFLGELALVDHGPRSADVEAITDCKLLRVDQPMLAAAAGVYPNAAFKFLIAIGRIMVERLRQSNRRYIDSLLFPVTGKD